MAVGISPSKYGCVTNWPFAFEKKMPWTGGFAIATVELVEPQPPNCKCLNGIKVKRLRGTWGPFFETAIVTSLQILI